MANIPQIAATYQNNIVSAFDVHKPDKLSKLFRRYGDQGASWYLKLAQMGFVLPVAQMQYSHYEDQLKNPTFQARAGVAQPAAGATMDITLAAVDVDTNNNFYPRLNDIVNFKGGQKGFIQSIDVTTPSQPVLTVAPLGAGASYRLPAVDANEEMSLTTNAFAEKTGQPKGIVPSAIERVNYTQIMKETLEVSGSEQTNQTWMTGGWANFNGVTMADGQVASGDTWYNVNFLDMEWRMNKQISGALLMGLAGDGTLVDDSGNAVQTTQGVVPTIQALGNNQTYTPGSLSVTDFDAWSRILDRNYAGDYVMGSFSKSLQDELENLLVAYLANTNIQFADPTVEKAVNIGFTALKKSQRNFMFDVEMAFSDRQTFGITGSIYEGAGMFIPVLKKRDAKSGQMVDNIGARYKEKNGYSRKMEIWSVSGSGPGMKVTDIDKSATYMRCDIGAHILGANQMIWLQPA
jgi:hypothetical protein